MATNYLLSAKTNQGDRIEKLNKSDALYIERKNTDYECKDCVFYKEKKCALYGQNVNIEPYGSCNYFMMGNVKEKDWLNTTTKAESGYEENVAGYSCKRCEYFDGKSKCEKVKGVISRDGCCDFWEKK